MQIERLGEGFQEFALRMEDEDKRIEGTIQDLDGKIEGKIEDLDGKMGGKIEDVEKNGARLETLIGSEVFFWRQDVTLSNVVSTGTVTSRPESEFDCLTCVIFARPRPNRVELLEARLKISRRTGSASSGSSEASLLPA